MMSATELYCGNIIRPFVSLIHSLLRIFMCSRGHGILPFLKDCGLDSVFSITQTYSLVHKSFILSLKGMTWAITSIASDDECAYAPKICVKDLVWNFSNFLSLIKAQA